MDRDGYTTTNSVEMIDNVCNVFTWPKSLTNPATQSAALLSL